MRAFPNTPTVIFISPAGILPSPCITMSVSIPHNNKQTVSQTPRRQKPPNVCERMAIQNFEVGMTTTFQRIFLISGALIRMTRFVHAVAGRCQGSERSRQLSSLLSPTSGAFMAIPRITYPFPTRVVVGCDPVLPTKYYQPGFCSTHVSSTTSFQERTVSAILLRSCKHKEVG